MNSKGNQTRILIILTALLLIPDGTAKVIHRPAELSDATRQAWSIGHARTLTFLQSVHELWKQMMALPVADPLNAYQWMLFVSEHIEQTTGNDQGPHLGSPDPSCR